MSVSTKAKAVVPYTNEALPDLNPKKPLDARKVKIKEVITPKETQSRKDTDPGLNVTEFRCQKYAEAMKGGAKFPPIKLIEVTDMPGHRDEAVLVVWDGHHTVGAAEIAKIDVLDALVWKGTWAQALAAASTLANVEHDGNGKPRDRADLVRGMHMYVKALLAAGIARKDLPSNRQLAIKFQISHTNVNDEDPCGRRQEGTKTPEQKKAEKKALRDAAKNGTANGVVAAGAAHLGTLAGPAEKRYEVVRRATGEIAGTYAGENAIKALEQFKAKTPGAVLTDFMTRELVVAPPKSGSAKGLSFDWGRIEDTIGHLARGLDGAGDMFNLKKRPEWKTAFANLNSILEIVKGLRAETKAKAIEEAKKAEAKKPEAKKAKDDSEDDSEVVVVTK